MMSKNIEININTGNDTYEALYPKASYQNMVDTLSILSTVGNLPLNRLAEKVSTAHVNIGEYIGTLGYVDKDNLYDSSSYFSITFSGENRVPDLLLITQNGSYTDNKSFGIFTSFSGKRYLFSHAFIGPRYITSTGGSSYSPSLTVYTYYGLSTNILEATQSLWTDNELIANNNQIFIRLAYDSINTTGFSKEATSAWTLANDGTKYKYYGFYFS